MKTIPVRATAQVVETDWVTFSGGELEGKRPRALCGACRDKLNREANSVRSFGPGAPRLLSGVPQNADTSHSASDTSHSAPGTSHSASRTSHSAPRTSHALCFQCYRAELDRERALKAAGEFDTASIERFQFALPLEPINHARLAQLKIERRNARVSQAAASPYVDRRMRAQINARHVLQRLAEGLRARTASERQQGMAAQQAAELQLPEAWLPFVASR